MSLGKFAAAADAGRVFSVSTVVAGLAIPVSTTTAPTVALWNPPGSKVRVNLLRYVIAAVSGTVAAGGIGFQWATANLSGLISTATKETYSVFSESEIVPAVIGSGAGSRIKASAAGTNTLTAAIVRFTSPCFTLGKDVVNTDIAGHQTLFYDFEGLVQLYPGVTIFPVGAAATGALFHQTIYWEEIPIAGI